MSQRKPRVLFLVLQAGHGGHTRSALTIARALRADGLAVKVAMPEGRQVAARDEDIPHLLLLPPQFARPLHDLGVRSQIVQAVRENTIDLIHSFDLRSHLVAYFVARTAGIPTIATICGGTLKHYYPFTRPVIVFSRELRDTLVNRFGWRPDQVAIEAARAEPPPPGRLSRQQVNERFNIDPERKLVVMVCRLISGLKTGSVLRGLEAIDLLAARRRDFVFLHVGAAQDDAALSQVNNEVERINARHGRRVAITDQSLARAATDAIAVADAVLGVGRVCFEAMSLGKPTLVVGDDGFAGMFEPAMPLELIDAIAYHNFSGRNVRGNPGMAAPQSLADALNRVLSDPGDADRCGWFARQWFQENQDVRKAARTYRGLYERILDGRDVHVDPWWRAAWGHRILIGGAVMDAIHRWRSR